MKIDMIKERKADEIKVIRAHARSIYMEFLTSR